MSLKICHLLRKSQQIYVTVEKDKVVNCNKTSMRKGRTEKAMSLLATSPQGPQPHYFKHYYCVMKFLLTQGSGSVSHLNWAQLGSLMEALFGWAQFNFHYI